MLKYKINIKQVSNDNVELIECYTLCLAQDGSFISGITSSDYGLVDGQTVFVNEDGTNYFDDYKISLKKTTIQGYVVVKQKYKIEKYNNGYVGFKFIDGNIYVFGNYNTLLLDSIYNDNEENVLVYTGQTEISINTRYFIEDGKVYINGEYYDVDFYDIDFVEKKPYIQIRNHTDKLFVHDIDAKMFNKPSLIKTVDVVKFIINKKENYPITIDNISCTRKFMYIKYPSNSETSHKYYLEKNYSEDKWELKGFIYDNDNKTYRYDTLSDVNIDVDYVCEYVKVNGEQYKIYDEWKNTTRGDKLHVYANSSDLTYSVGQTILVHKLNTSHTARIDVNSYLDTNVKSVKYNGIIYYTPIDEATKETKKLIYVDYFGEKLLFNESLKNWGIDDSISTEFPSADKYGFILVNDMPLLMYISGDKARTMNDYSNNPSVSSITDTFETIEYEFIEIDNIKHIIKNTSRYVEIDGKLSGLTNEYIELFDSSPIKLLIEDIHSGNQLRCSILSESYDNSDMMYMLSINYSDFLFELENEMFNSSAISIAPNSERGYTIPIYNIYKPIDNINIPILLSNYNGTNLHQEFVVDNMFFGVEEQKSINPSIDMEKDIYYPITIVTDGADSGITEVDEIIFDLHFRTRTIDDWKVVSDNNITFKDEDNNEVGAIKCNYNILDYYDWSKDNASELIPQIHGDHVDKFKKYQPSDLLYFLGFTDDDIFYQKNKVGKSFLRLSFYNGNNPNTSDLLYTSTVFMNEGSLYKKFLDNSQGGGQYMSVKEVENVDKRIKNSIISVSYDTYEEDTNSDNKIIGKFTCDESKRLSSRFTIKNMFECEESSEGFYLYLFKNFSQGLREQTIYMRVQFNHAGVGKTINFTQPFKEDENQNKSMLEFPDDINILKSGCTLNKLYDNLFIEIKVKYDFDLRKFVYYLPSWLVDTDNLNQMHFNLYELKIADESNVGIIRENPNK